MEKTLSKIFQKRMILGQDIMERWHYDKYWLYATFLKFCVWFTTL